MSFNRSAEVEEESVIQKRKFRLFEGDKVMWFVLIFLALVSMVVVFSAGGKLYYNKYGDYSLNEYIRHIVTIVFGLGAALVSSRINYKIYSKLYGLIYVFALVLLALMLVFGIESNAARRDLPIPFLGASIQPSEVAKIAIVIYLARVLGDAAYRGLTFDYRTAVLRLMLPVFAMVAFIFGESLSCVVIIVVVAFVLFYVSGVGRNVLLTYVGIGVVGLLLVMSVKLISSNIQSSKGSNDVENVQGVRDRSGTRVGRIKRWLDFNHELDPKELMQEDYALLAIANGGLTGKAPGNSNERYFLSESHNDFIYAIIIEEYGAIIGGAGVLVLYVLFMFRAFRLYQKRPNTFGGLLAFGIAFCIVLQALINMGIVVGLLPVTGETLPFISKGGTSIVITGLAMGIVINISKVVKEENKNGTEYEVTD